MKIGFFVSWHIKLKKFKFSTIYKISIIFYSSTRLCNILIQCLVMEFVQIQMIPFTSINFLAGALKQIQNTSAQTFIQAKFSFKPIYPAPIPERTFYFRLTTSKSSSQVSKLFVSLSIKYRKKKARNTYTCVFIFIYFYLCWRIFLL